MSTIFGSPNDAYALGSQVRVDTEAHEDLQNAVAEAPKDDAGKTDPLKVLQLAAQGAMQAGHVQVADKFLKQSQAYQAQSTETQLNEFKLQHQKTDAAISQLQTADTPDVAKKLIMSGPAPENVKMQLVAELSQLGDDPAKYKVWRKQHEDALLTTKERTEAGIKLLELARKEEADKRLERHQLAIERIQAQRGMGGTPKETPEDKEDRSQLHEDVNTYKADARDQINAIMKDYSLEPGEKTKRINAIKAERDNKIKSRREEWKHRDDEPDTSPKGASKDVVVTPDEVKSMSQKNIQQLVDGSVSEKEFENHYGKPPGWAKKVVDIYRKKDKPVETTKPTQSTTSAPVVEPTPAPKVEAPVKPKTFEDRLTEAATDPVKFKALAKETVAEDTSAEKEIDTLEGHNSTLKRSLSLANEKERQVFNDTIERNKAKIEKLKKKREMYQGVISQAKARNLY